MLGQMLYLRATLGCDFILEIRVIHLIRGQEHDRILTTDSADHTDKSQR